MAKVARRFLQELESKHLPTWIPYSSVQGKRILQGCEWMDENAMGMPQKGSRQRASLEAPVAIMLLSSMYHGVPRLPTFPCLQKPRTVFSQSSYSTKMEPKLMFAAALTCLADA